MGFIGCRGCRGRDLNSQPSILVPAAAGSNLANLAGNPADARDMGTPGHLTADRTQRRAPGVQAEGWGLGSRCDRAPPQLACNGSTFLLWFESLWTTRSFATKKGSG